MFTRMPIRQKLWLMTLIPLIALMIICVYEAYQVKIASDQVDGLSESMEMVSYAEQKGFLGKTNQQLRAIPAKLKRVATNIEELEQDTLLNVALLSIVTILIASIINIFLSRKIITPLNKALYIADQISKGHRNVDIEVCSEDETGQLLKSLKAMQASIIKAEKDLGENERFMRTITDGLPALISYVDKEQRLQFCNLQFARRFGRHPRHLVGMYVKDVIGAKRYEEIRPYIKQAIQGLDVQFELVANESGDMSYLSVYYIADRDQNSKHQGYFSITHDVSELRKASIELEKQRKELEVMSQTDALTGVLNRHSLMDHIDTEIERSKRYSKPLSIMMLDLDYFKKINDVHGHTKGDEVLRIVSGILKENARPMDYVTRYGGEEFSILLPETNLQQAHVVAERFRHIIEDAHIKLEDGTQIDFTCSIGVADYNESIRNGETFIAIADEALYRAKKEGRNRVIIAQDLMAHG